MRIKGKRTTTKEPRTCKRFTRTLTLVVLAPLLLAPAVGSPCMGLRGLFPSHTSLTLALFAEKRGEGRAGFIRSHGDGK